MFQEICKRSKHIWVRFIKRRYLNFLTRILGKLGIELERKMIIHNDRDPEVWKKPDIDQNEIERARKISSPSHQVSKKQFIFVHLIKKKI